MVAIAIICFLLLVLHCVFAGAGKSTTIAMLTGLIPPTDGDATAFGMSITENMPALRKSMGVCPQQ